MTLSFVGMQPPEFNEPLIGLERLGGGFIDLYNECELRAVILKGTRLVFDFVALSGENWDVRGEWIQLQFDGVRGLCVNQPLDWDPGEASQIEHLFIRPVGPWQRVEFHAAGRIFSLDAEELALVAGNTAPPSSRILGWQASALRGGRSLFEDQT